VKKKILAAIAAIIAAFAMSITVFACDQCLFDYEYEYMTLAEFEAMLISEGRPVDIEDMLLRVLSETTFPNTFVIQLEESYLTELLAHGSYEILSPEEVVYLLDVYASNDFDTSLTLSPRFSFESRLIPYMSSSSGAPCSANVISRITDQVCSVSNLTRRCILHHELSFLACRVCGWTSVGVLTVTNSNGCGRQW